MRRFRFFVWLLINVLLPLFGLGLALFLAFLLAKGLSNPLPPDRVGLIIGSPDVLFVGIVAGAGALANVTEAVQPFLDSKIYTVSLAAIVVGLFWTLPLYGGLVAIEVLTGPIFRGSGLYLVVLWTHAGMLILLSIIIQRFLHGGPRRVA